MTKSYREKDLPDGWKAPEDVEPQPPVYLNFPVNPFWGQLDDITLEAAVLLTFGIDPAYPSAYIDSYDEQPSLTDDFPEGYLKQKEIIESAVRAEKLKTLETVKLQNGRINMLATRVTTEVFREWCRERGFQHHLPERTDGDTLTSKQESNLPDTNGAIHSYDLNPGVFDPISTSGISNMFRLDKEDKNNTKIWERLAKDAVRNGLRDARVTTGKGRAQSTFNPYLVGEWAIKHRGLDRAKVDRILLNNLPHRSAYLRDLTAI